MDVVVIPCYDRPEFLAITLELIQKANRANEFVYLFSLDSGYDMTCKEVIKSFELEKVVVHRKKTSYKLGKQSYNLLSAYAEACYLSDSKVVLIEDDIFIHPDFFNWHLQVHEKEQNCFCSIGTENHNSFFEHDKSDEGYYYGAQTDYQSWGVMWNKNILENYILEHSNQMYYTDPVNYLHSTFKQEWIGRHFAEQDGLIRRVRYEHPEHQIIYPTKPRAFHAGFYSYHRNTYNKLKGNLSKKIDQIKNIVFTPELYREHCENPDFYEDSQAIDLNYIFQNESVNLKKATPCQKKKSS